MAILVIQHADMCRPGRLGLTLRDHAFKLDIRRPDRGEALPQDLDDVEGMICLPGPQQVDQDLPWIEEACELIRQAHAAQLPVLGVCLGAQMVAHALGGEVGACKAPEAGFVDVEIVGPGQTDTLLAGIAWRSAQFVLHSYEVKTPPPGAQVLARSASGAVRAFRAGLRTYGFQFHFEADRPMIDAILQDAASDRAHFSLDDAQINGQINAQIDEHYADFARLADRLCVNIATCLIPRVANAIRS